MKYFFCILLFIIAQRSVAQSSSLIKELKEQALNKEVDRIKRIAAYNQLTTIYYNRDVKRAKRYCEEAYQLAQKDSLSIGMGNVLNDQGLLSFGLGQYELAIKKVTQAIKIAEYLNRPILKATAYARLSLIYSMKGYAYKAIEYSIKSINIAKQVSNKTSLLLGYYHIGKSYANLQDTSKAILYYKKASAYLGKEKDKNSGFNLYAKGCLDIC